MSDFTSRANKLLTALLEDSEQLDMFKLKQAKEECKKKGSNWYWCNTSQKCKTREAPADSALNESN